MPPRPRSRPSVQRSRLPRREKTLTQRTRSSCRSCAEGFASRKGAARLRPYITGEVGADLFPRFATMAAAEVSAALAQLDHGSGRPVPLAEPRSLGPDAGPLAYGALPAAGLEGGTPAGFNRVINSGKLF